MGTNFHTQLYQSKYYRICSVISILCNSVVVINLAYMYTIILPLCDPPTPPSPHPLLPPHKEALAVQYCAPTCTNSTKGCIVLHHSTGGCPIHRCPPEWNRRDRPESHRRKQYLARVLCLRAACVYVCSLLLHIYANMRLAIFHYIPALYT